MGLDLSGRRVFITGAAAGIGRALALEFLRRGAKVTALDLDPAGLQSLKDECRTLGLAVDTVVADVSEPHRFLEALEAASAAGGAPYVFVNNAGIAKPGGAQELGLDHFERVLRVNLNGTAAGTFFALGKMRAAGGGVIVNIASMAGLMPAPYLASYAASKHAVVGFTRSLREELKMAGSPVRLCLVSPGFVDTAIMRHEGFEFPSWMKPMIGRPEAAAGGIVNAVVWGCDEVTPDLGGKLMRLCIRLSPGLSAWSARLLLARLFGRALGLSRI